jgi:ABC-2 type transport system permease protein
MSPVQPRGRLSTLAGAFIIARRDFLAILWSRSFIFFLLGPLFPVFVGAMAGSIGSKVQQTVESPQVGLIMAGKDIDAMLTARNALSPVLGDGLPQLAVVKRLKTGETADAKAALADKSLNGGNLSAILTGTIEAPVLTGTQGRITNWRGGVALIAAKASGHGPDLLPAVVLSPTATSTAAQNQNRFLTAQGAQTLLFLLTMLLAGMVLSNLVEEKGNKIIEILAAAIPMDSVFFGKLFAMLAVSLVGIAVWGGAGLIIHFVGGAALPNLVLGAIFLAIGALATTVREIQTLNMPVTMGQLMVFFFASYALARQDTATEYAAIAIPFSSPFAMLARAATHEAIWPHLAALCWQALWVALFVKGGATMFRKRVMKSGPQGAPKKKRSLLAALKAR